MSIGLTEFSDATSFSAVVDARVPHLRQATYTNKALRTALDQSFASRRADVPQTVVLITDGNPTFFIESDTYVQADALRAAGIDVIVVAIGQSVTMEKMVTIAGGDASKVIFATSLDEIYKNLDALSGTVCAGETTLRPTGSKRI